MILIVDDNEYRRKSLVKICRNALLPAMGCAKEDLRMYTCPLITVIVEPRTEDLLRENGRNTIYVFYAKRYSRAFEACKYITINPDIVLDPDKIKKVLNNEYGYKLGYDAVGPISIDNKDRSIYIGGKNLLLTSVEFKIASFFIYQYYKGFRLDEIFEYLNCTGKISNGTFFNHVSAINSKSRQMRNVKLIISDGMKYKVNTKITEKILRIVNK